MLNVHSTGQYLEGREIYCEITTKINRWNGSSWITTVDTISNGIPFFCHNMNVSRYMYKLFIRYSNKILLVSR